MSVVGGRTIVVHVSQDIRNVDFPSTIAKAVDVVFMNGRIVKLQIYVLHSLVPVVTQLIQRALDRQYLWPPCKLVYPNVQPVHALMQQQA